MARSGSEGWCMGHVRLTSAREEEEEEEVEKEGGGICAYMLVLGETSVPILNGPALCHMSGDGMESTYIHVHTYRIIFQMDN